MAISLDTSTGARSGTTTTVNIAAAESNEIAWIAVWPGTGTITSVKVGGIDATLAATITATGGNLIRVYYFLNPPTSSTAYTCVASATVEIQVALYKGASQTGVPDSSNTSEDLIANPFTISTTVVLPNSWLFSAARDYISGALTPGTGTTQRGSPVGLYVGDSNGTVGTGSQSMGWVPNSAGEATFGAIVSFAPAGGAAATTRVRPNLLLLNVG